MRLGPHILPPRCFLLKTDLTKIKGKEINQLSHMNMTFKHCFEFISIFNSNIGQRTQDLYLDTRQTENQMIQSVESLISKGAPLTPGHKLSVLVTG